MAYGRVTRNPYTHAALPGGVSLPTRLASTDAVVVGREKHVY